MKAPPQTGLFAGYDDAYHPLGSYAVLAGAYGVSLAGFLGWRRHKGLPERLELGDLALFGVATHSLTRLVAKDRVTSFLRAPFVRFEEDSTAGEVEETSRGTGMRKALGQLVGCPFCLGPWVAAGFLAAHVVAPRQVRWVGSVLALSAVSSVLHRAYEWLGEGLHLTRERGRLLKARADHEESVQFPTAAEAVEPGPIPAPS
ncbi:DUF1360 domain-containing protein [Pyxidicoccus fallax]|uniref:DUF1360 domain-containing protein n=1 Tax=Pyxidicoccus fallax TaxID=394095 RepID=A0A848L6C7_9BACT|nr:DUF1360 domain-containing protein [Pyxidicoccus fallax]NMO14510.1 DUF1360 domain-containing protein [Pyxidicoccus fallax]NPC83676.1 DUF1360 domain-containing protein [Pyxidicoccus fallax]